MIRSLRAGKDPMSRRAADLLEKLDERVAIMSEGRQLIDATALARELILLSACAGGMTGCEMLKAVEKVLERMNRV